MNTGGITGPTVVTLAMARKQLLKQKTAMSQMTMIEGDLLQSWMWKVTDDADGYPELLSSTNRRRRIASALRTSPCCTHPEVKVRKGIRSAGIEPNHADSRKLCRPRDEADEASRYDEASRPRPVCMIISQGLHPHLGPPKVRKRTNK